MPKGSRRCRRSGVGGALLSLPRRGGRAAVVARCRTRRLFVLILHRRELRQFKNVLHASRLHCMLPLSLIAGHTKKRNTLSLQIIETVSLSPPSCCTQAAARPSNGRCGYACGAYGPLEARWRTAWSRLTPPPLKLCAVAFVAAAAAMQPPLPPLSCPPPPPSPAPSISLNGAVSLALGTPLLWRTEVLLYGRLPPHPLPIPPVKTW